MTLMSVYTQGDVEEGCLSLKPDVRAFLDGSAALLSFPPEAEHDEAAGRPSGTEHACKVKGSSRR
jgi:hypothetical protein